MNSHHLLLVEDDETIRSSLRDFFAGQGYRVTDVADGDAARFALRDPSVELVLLDLMLPGPGGLELLQEFRSRGATTPVIILTARGEEGDKVLGLELGADDYVTKPFGLREIMARVRAHLRRSGAVAGIVPRRFEIGQAQVDLASYQVTRGEESFALSPKEVGVLELLYGAEGEVVGRARFLDEVWGADQFVSNRTVDTHILHLRQKLEADPKQPAHLLTVHGVGYRLQR